MIKFKSKLKKHITVIASIEASWLEDLVIGEDGSYVRCPDLAVRDELYSIMYCDSHLFYGDNCDTFLALKDPHDTVEVTKNINDRITELKVIRTEYK